MSNNTVVFQGTNFINLTPHAIVLRFEGEEVTFPASGVVARVSEVYDEAVGCFVRSRFGEVQNLPEESDGTRFIVSGLVFGAVPQHRIDVVAPATGHASVARNDKGHILSVPYFLTK